MWPALPEGRGKKRKRKKRPDGFPSFVQATIGKYLVIRQE